MSERGALTHSIAERLISMQGDETLDLREFTVVEEQAAQLLCQHKGDLNFLGVEELPDAVVSILCKHKGNRLILSGLKSLSDTAATSFGKHKGILVLDGIESLSDAAAKSLSEHHAGPVTLNGLKTLQSSPGHIALARAVTNHFHGWMSTDAFFGGLENVSEEVAAILAEHERILT